MAYTKSFSDYYKIPKLQNQFQIPKGIDLQRFNKKGMWPRDSAKDLVKDLGLVGLSSIIPYAPYVVSGLASLYKYAKRKKRRPFEETEFGKTLSQIGREGKYSPTTKSKILGLVGAEAGNIASQRVAERRGLLLNRGMGGSIAGIRTITEPRRQVMGELSKTAKELEIENELSKRNAQREFGLGKMQYEEGERQEENVARGELAGGIVGASMGALQSHYQQKQFTQQMGLKGAELKLKAEDIGLKREKFISDIDIKQKELDLKTTADEVNKTYREGLIEVRKQQNLTQVEKNQKELELDKWYKDELIKIGEERNKILRIKTETPKLETRTSLQKNIENLVPLLNDPNISKEMKKVIRIGLGLEARPQNLTANELMLFKLLGISPENMNIISPDISKPGEFWFDEQ